MAGILTSNSVFAAAGGGGGTPTFVTSVTGTGTTSNPTASFGRTASAGELIVLVVSADDYNTTPPTGYTESTGCGQEGFLGHYLWWKIAAGGETSVQYTIGSAVPSCWAILFYTGLNASPYDISSGQHADTSGATYTTPSLTPSAGSRLIIGTIGANDSGGATMTLDTWLNSFTERADSTVSGSAGEVAGAAELVVTANGSTAYSTGATYTPSIADGRSAIIIAFKP